jgi:Ser/Thr protein kinase RdoA (MazF antagonist)
LTFAVFPKKGGRALEEPTPEQWKELGRLLARLHTVGEQHAPRDRVRLHPEISSSQHLDFILEGDFPSARVRDDYAEVADDILERIAPLFDDLPTTRLHGDCHRANILGRPGEPFFLIDFDDMCVGPPVQDLWMMLPGLLKNSRAEMDLLLEGYETFRDFDYATLRLIEPLRAMRIIHYTAWCARQKRDGGFARVAPDWGSTAFWRQETADLQRQRQEIEDALAGSAVIREPVISDQRERACGRWSKWRSRVKSGRLCCTASAAIQISLVGMGVPCLRSWKKSRA